ncbi:MAG TPA: ammonium transporter [Planctomycetota bacterium]|jgi:Amt family ammonium transporter|nr:ammonium transporter [Planctomycetota bacterium]
MSVVLIRVGVLLLAYLLPALAQEAAVTAAVTPAVPVCNSGDTAWVLMSAVLVLFMTVPGFALFYAGLVRTKNVLTIFTQCFAITCLVTILWTIYGYSLAFDTTGQVAGQFSWNSIIGTFGKALLLNVTPTSVHPLAATIPEPVFFFFQLTFAIITPALLVGAFAERMKFSAVLWVAALWLTFVYVPICHMAWGGPSSLGALFGLQDLAGGTVVEVNSGIAGLVCAIMVGRRVGWPQHAMLPHNAAMCITGAAMLWVGWFGFNAGSALAANELAARAAFTTQIAAAMGGFTWLLIEWFKVGKPGAVGIATGAVAGLVAITPACGYVGPIGALVIGAAAGACSFYVVTHLKGRFGFDDSLDVFGVHGVGGMVGLIGTGIFASATLGGVGYADGRTMGGQVLVQLGAMVFTILISSTGTAAILFAVGKTIGLRESETDEVNGLDYVQHGENAYNP